MKYEDIPALQVPYITVVQGSVRSLDSEGKIATVATHGVIEELQLGYDYLVAATGLRRAWPVVPQSLRRKQYLFEVEDHHRNVKAAKHGVVVVGRGVYLNEHQPQYDILLTDYLGAVGIEMAAELKLIHPTTDVTLVHSRDKLLSAELLPEETKDKALELVREANVNVLISHRLETVEELNTGGQSGCFNLTFHNGHSMQASKVIMAVSKSIPTTTFLPQAALDEDGYVNVHSK